MVVSIGNVFGVNAVNLWIDFRNRNPLSAKDLRCEKSEFRMAWLVTTPTASVQDVFAGSYRPVGDLPTKTGRCGHQANGGVMPLASG